MDQEDMKRIVSKEALAYLQDDIVLGMGSGSTVEIFIQEMSKAGFRNLRIVPSSSRTEDIIRKKGYRIVELEDKCDIYIDGADAVDRDFRLIKGGGGALTREKVIAYNSIKRIIIVDETKIRERLTGIHMPVEILRFSHMATMKRIEEMGLSVKLRGGKQPFITDNGNYIVDVLLNEDHPPEEVSLRLKTIPGVVETGLFINLADLVLVGKKDGSVKKISRIS